MAKAPFPAPDRAGLSEAALAYLARYAATRASLRRMLQRRVERWARQQDDPAAAQETVAAARGVIEAVIEQMVHAGAVNDAAFAEARARSLSRAGKSARAVAGKLVAKGVAPEMAHAAVDTDPDTELAAALVLVRRRRIGPYRSGEAADAAAQARELGILARAGFPREIAERALNTDPDEAERRILALRR